MIFEPCRLVEDETEGRLALPHLPRDVVATAELVADALALRVEDEAADAPERLRREELHLRCYDVCFPNIEMLEKRYYLLKYDEL